MWLVLAVGCLVAAIVGHAGVRRLAPTLNSVLAFLLVGGAVGIALVVGAVSSWRTSVQAWAALAAYAFGCELYIFLFSSISGSISVSLLYQLRTKYLSSADIEDQFGGKAMVERRLAKMIGAGLLSVTPAGYRHTERGARLLWMYRHVRNFFWRTPLISEIVTRTDPGPFSAVVSPATITALRTRAARALAVVALALVPVLLFWPHIARDAVFIGDSDRLNHFLSVLRFLTDGYREGRVYGWDPYLFGGFPLVPFTNPYPTSVLHLLWPPADLFHAAGIVSCGLVVAAAWAAYAFLSDLGVSPLAGFVGASLYVLCGFAILKISQNDITYSAIVLIPLGMLALRRVRRDNLVGCYVGLFCVLTYLMMFAFLQLAAYAMVLFTAYALFRATITRNWRVVLVCAAASASAFLASLPRIYAVAEDFLQSARYTTAAYRNFNRLWIDSGFGLHEILRWLDDRIFGRYVSEVAALRNNFNIHEGMLLYMSAFAAFFLLYGLLRHRRIAASGADDRAFFVGVAVVCFAVVATKTGYRLAYILFFKIEFIHSRVVVAAMLPLAALIALFLDGELTAGGSPLRRRWLATIGGVAAAVVVAAAIEHIAEAFGAHTIGPTISRRSGVLHLLEGPVFRIVASLVVFVVLAIAERWRARPGVRSSALAMLAFLMVTQAFFYARVQVAGAHMRAQWPPFQSPTRLLADAEEFSVPTADELSAVAARLETDKFRSSFVCPPEISGIFCPAHLAHFWKIRAIDGYLNAVPRRVTAIPWGPGAITLRALMFTDFRTLPWGVLGLYNVKYAIALTPELMTNTVRLAGGRTRHFGPGDARIVTNPLPVAPRAFFTRSVTAVKGLAAASEALFRDDPRDRAYDPISNSVVEGFAADARFAAEGVLDAAFDPDRVTVEFPPAASDRFLVVNERYDPRWKAFAGDRELRVYPTNVLMRGVVVPAGARRIVMTYVPATRAPGAWACYGGALALAIAAVVLLRRLETRARPA